MKSRTAVASQIDNKTDALFYQKSATFIRMKWVLKHFYILLLILYLIVENMH
jgi:hypothetical protein